MPVQAVVPLAEVEVVGGIAALAVIAQSHGREHPDRQVQVAEAVGPVLAATADRGLAVHRPGCCRAAEDPDAEEAVHAAPGGPLLVVVDVGVADFARGPLLVDVIVVRAGVGRPACLARGHPLIAVHDLCVAGGRSVRLAGGHPPIDGHARVAGGRPPFAVGAGLHRLDEVPVLHHQLAPHCPYLGSLLPPVAFGLAAS